LALPVGHALADELGAIPPRYVLLNALRGAHLTVLLPQGSRRSSSFALSIGHALADKLCPVSSCDVFLHGLRGAHLPVLFA
jgi:hypothetical protein